MSGAASSLLAVAGPAAAAVPQVSFLTLGIELLGGLALFLYGMEKMADALRAVAGERMRLILSRLTSNRFIAAATGAFVTAVVQSSSVTTVMVVGLSPPA